MGMDFPKPFVLKIDNAAAKVFADNSSFKSKLKHIDCRQHWVKTLRDKNICRTEHVPSKENIADLFTKILNVEKFEYLRNKIMYTLK